MACPNRLGNVYPQDSHSLTEKGLEKPALVYLFQSRGIEQSPEVPSDHNYSVTL